MDKPLISINGFAVIVTDKNDKKFIRTTAHGEATATVCTNSLADYIMNSVSFFYNKEIAKCFLPDTIDSVRRGFANSMICPIPPFKAEVVPVKFSIG